MSVRGFRIWKGNRVNEPSVLVEKTGHDHSLLFKNGAILELGVEAAEVEKQSYTKISDAYGLMGVLRLGKDESVLVAVTGVLSVGQLYNVDIFKVTACDFILLRSTGVAEFLDPRVADLQRLLSSGMFYFSSSNDFDLISSAQRRAKNLKSDPRFFWNHSLYHPFDRFGIDTKTWLMKSMAGSVLVKTVYVGHRTGRVALISRLSCERVGTRFNVRGANHLGHVANFVETEQLIVFDDRVSSLVQIRGSIPLFWEQPGVQVGSHKVKLRAFEASAPAYHRHMTSLLNVYENVVIVNLLGHKEGERMLAEAFKKQHKNTKMDQSIQMINFDYHARVKSSKDAINQLKAKLLELSNNYSFFVSCDGNTKSVQRGVIRVNCLDCLDRTNCVETVYGLHHVASQVASLELDGGKVNVAQRIEEILKDLWQKNGDQCSTIYAGTGALDGKSKLKDASRSIARTIQNNLMDGSKQESFDLFLAGSSFDARVLDKISNLLPTSAVNEYTNAVTSIIERSQEFTSNDPVKVFIGTWNVNGGKNIHNVAFRGECSLSDWIFPSSLINFHESDEIPDIVAIGVEELVDLNASNMMKASTTNQRVWCESIRSVLHKKAAYLLVACEQLVGVCLYLFVRPEMAPRMKDFSVASVKTGMGGATGNKGSVAFRIVVNSTSFCFVCSHFAAGQNEVKDRNEDFFTALRKIRFAQGREIDSHDVVFWLGDFNYRINLSGDEVKRAVAANQLEQLVPNDQLTQQKAQGLTFPGFEEGPLTFAPTYKYDTFSDDYDTSEKCRSPAWTDRILWKEKRLPSDTRLLRYYRAEIKTSDHRPVGALFSVNTHRVEGRSCAEVFNEVVCCMGPPDGTIICSVEGQRVFPAAIYTQIATKLSELHATILASKFEGSDLWIILDSGESALAAISMDGLKIGAERYELSVRLRTPLWAEDLEVDSSVFELTDTFTPVEDSTADGFEFDDDEELASVSFASSTCSAPPERPRPPSSRSDNIQLASLDWNDDRTSPNVLPVPERPMPSIQTVPLLHTQAPPPHPIQPQRMIPVAHVAPVPPPRPNVPVVPPRPKGW